MSWKIIFLGLSVVVLAGGIAFLAGRPAAATARVELAVEKLTCGACSQKIRTAARELPGVGEVTVDVAAGRATVAFDPQRVAPDAIAGRITAAGYPATALAGATGSPADAERLSALYVGRIGERLVSRDEFTYEVDALRGAAGGPRFTEAQLRRVAWRQIVERNQPQGGAALPVQVFDPFLKPAPAGGGSGCSCCG